MAQEQQKLDALDLFGRFFMETLRDYALDKHAQVVQGTRAIPLSGVLHAMTEEQRAAVLQCVVVALDAGIHNFLYHLAQNADQYGDDGPEMSAEEQQAIPHIQVLANGEDIAWITDYLYWRFNTDSDGWITQYSKHQIAAENLDG